MKDHVTLNNGFMANENSEISYILMYIQIENGFHL